MTQATDDTGIDDAKPADTRSAAQIERDIEATRERLAGTIDQIGVRVSPSTIAARAKDKARDQVVDEHGSIRAKRVIAAGGAAAAVVALKVIAAIRKR